MVFSLVLLAPDRDGVTRASASTRSFPLAVVSINPLAPGQSAPRSYFGLSTEYWTLPLVDKGHQNRIGRNKSLFRNVNEAIESGRWQGEEGLLTAFRCECGRLGCSDLIELTLREYERVRADPRRFVLAIGHEMPEAERIVESPSGLSGGSEAGRGRTRSSGARPPPDAQLRSATPARDASALGHAPQHRHGALEHGLILF